MLTHSERIIGEIIVSITFILFVNASQFVFVFEICMYVIKFWNVLVKIFTIGMFTIYEKITKLIYFCLLVYFYQNF